MRGGGTLDLTVAERRQGMAELRSALETRERQLIELVRELHQLASAEQAAGKVSHASRSKLFSHCAAVFESLGPKAFAAEELTSEG